MLRNHSVPQCTVIPEIPYPDVEAAVKWLADAFGFTLRLRIADHRAQMNVGEDGAIVVTDQGHGDFRSRTMIRIVDSHAHCARARQNGAIIKQEPRDFEYGERQYSAVDFAGNLWSFTESIADVHPRDWKGIPVVIGDVR